MGIWQKAIEYTRHTRIYTSTHDGAAAALAKLSLRERQRDNRAVERILTQSDVRVKD